MSGVSAADAPAPVTFRNDDHRNIAVRHPVGKRAQESNDLTIVDRDKSTLRPRWKSEGRGIPDRDTSRSGSALNGDYVCLNLAVHRTRPEPLGNRFRCDVGCFAEPRLVTRLDLVA